MNFSGLNSEARAQHIHRELLVQVELSCDPGRSRQDHHLIPREVWDKDSIVKELGLQNDRLAYDSPQNRMLLPSTHLGAAASGLAMHRSQHPAYSEVVKTRLRKLYTQYKVYHDGDKRWLAQEFSTLQLNLRKSLDRSYAQEVPQNYLREDDPLMPIVLSSQLLEMKEGPDLENEIRKYEADPARGYPLRSMEGQGCKEEFVPITKEQAKALGDDIRAGAWAGVDREDPSPVPVARAQDPQLVERLRRIIQSRMSFAAENPMETAMYGIGAAALLGIAVLVSSYASPLRIAGAAGMAVLGFVTPSAAATSDEQQIQTLPALSHLHSEADIMGPRSAIDHIDWRFTKWAQGDPRNTLEALHARDTSPDRPDGPLNHTGAHFLMKQDGSLVFSEKYSRPLTSNPQIAAGHNANAIGIYVEGDGVLTPAQRQRLEDLNHELSAAWASQGNSLETRLQPAGYAEQTAWVAPTALEQNMTPAPDRALLRTPRASLQAHAP